MKRRADVFDVQTRSAIMRAVKSRDTAPERAVRKIVRDLGYFRRYRIGAGAPGKPDLVFGALHKVVFVHGCFWHGHECKRGARAPKDNAAYWRAKIAANRRRDVAVARALSAAGWKRLTVWECETRDAARLRLKLARFLSRAPRRGKPAPPTRR
jgi:DNA mismatch endonuclease (patch repair protein)